MTNSVVYSGNDWRLRLRGLRNASGAIVANATVTLEALVDRDGNALIGVSLPATFTALTGGDYELQVPRTSGLAAEKRYFATVRAENAGLRGEWRETLVCKKRES